MAMEVRYVGTRGVNQWSTLNYNERNLIENGFYDEFLKARTNLQAHVAAGCGTTGQPACSFAYRGPGTGTQPLPIYLAYLSGRPAADANTAANYTGTDWTNTALTADMGRFNPSPSGSAADLDGDVTRRNRATSAAVGLPANFFVLNPVASGVNVQDSGAFSDYHALQLEASAPAVEGPDRERQLSVRARRRIVVPRLPLRPGHGSGRQRASRHQGAVGLDGSSGPRPALRHRPEPVAERPCLAGGSSAAPHACSRE
jgi:hypothetical protein